MENMLALFVLGLIGLVAQTNGSGLSPCIKTCKGLSDGDYQSCHSCKVYATCSNGILYDSRPCPADLVWDDTLKRCEYTSETCGKCGQCINHCDDGKPDGLYQSCTSCSKYITCARGQTFTFDCPESLIWDDDRKICDAQSGTCGPGCEEEACNQPCKCIKNCVGLSDGDYQSCHSCHVYATCASGILYDRRECPAGLYWDDNKKRCEWSSSTCGEDCDVDEPKCDCVKECDGVDDGDYQSCYGCGKYVSCKLGMTYDKQKCPAGLVWDDFKKRCQYDSSTCGEECEAPGVPPDLCECVDDCKNKPNGKYQSCKGCSVFEKCKDSKMINKMCPTGLVWDDKKKKCQYVSKTCAPQCQPEFQPCNCIHSCDDLPNGDYQSCKGCNMYATCTKKKIEDGKLCPSGLFWDDHMKACNDVSQTCNEKCYNKPTKPPPASTKPPPQTKPTKPPATKPPTKPPRPTTLLPTTTVATTPPDDSSSSESSDSSSDSSVSSSSESSETESSSESVSKSKYYKSKGKKSKGKKSKNKSKYKKSKKSKKSKGKKSKGKKSKNKYYKSEGKKSKGNTKYYKSKGKGKGKGKRTFTESKERRLLEILEEFSQFE